jgi:hypothetical protein
VHARGVTRVRLAVLSRAHTDAGVMIAFVTDDSSSAAYECVVIFAHNQGAS